MVVHVRFSAKNPLSLYGKFSKRFEIKNKLCLLKDDVVYRVKLWIGLE